MMLNWNKSSNSARYEKYAPSNPVDTMLLPPYSFQKAATDLFQLNGQNYITYTNRLMGWLEVKHISEDTTSARLITIFTRWLKRFGILKISCDGGTNLTNQESKNFLDVSCVRLWISSANYPQSSGYYKAVLQ